MSILVIGGTGFVGPHVIRRLAARGEDISCMDINIGVDLFAGLKNEVTVIRGDVTQFKGCQRLARTRAGMWPHPECKGETHGPA